MSADEKVQLYRPVSEVSYRMLRKQRKRVLKIGKHIQDLDDKGLHKLRIACKNLRYLADFFRDVYEQESFLRLIECLKKLQDVLGKLHDHVVFSSLLGLLDQAPNDTELPTEAMVELKSPVFEVDRLRAKLGQRWESFIAIDLPAPQP